MEEVKRFYGIKKFSERSDAEARRVCVSLLKERAGLPLADIGKMFGCSYSRVGHIARETAARGESLSRAEEIRERVEAGLAKRKT